MLDNALSFLLRRSSRLPPGVFPHQWALALIAAAVARHWASTPALPGMSRLVVVEHAPGEGGRLAEGVQALLREVAGLCPALTPARDRHAHLCDMRAADALVDAVFAPAEGIPAGHGRVVEMRTPLRPPDARVSGWVRHYGEAGARLRLQLTAQERRERLVGYWPAWGPLRLGPGPDAHLWSPVPAVLSLEGDMWRLEGLPGGPRTQAMELTVRAPGLALQASAFRRPLPLRHALALAGPDPGVVLAVAGRFPPADGTDEIAPGLWLSRADLLVHQRSGVRVNGADAYVTRVPLGKLRRLEVEEGGHPYGPGPLVAAWDAESGVLRFQPPYGVHWNLHPSDDPVPEWRLLLRRASVADAGARALVVPFRDPAVPSGALVTVEPVAVAALWTSCAGVALRLPRSRPGAPWRKLVGGEHEYLQAPAEFAVGGTLFQVDPAHYPHTGD